MKTIDIGGGFSTNNFKDMAESIRFGINTFFPKSMNCNFIAEPGRYFAESIATLYTRIIGVRERRNMREYFITDSLYGSFNCILYDHYEADPFPMIDIIDTTKYMSSAIYGPTCDGLDKIADNIMLPVMNVGDWFKWSNMGAYTIAGACDFNGIPFTQAKVIYL